jgi:methylglutaconyl-CoA hydratase
VISTSTTPDGSIRTISLDRPQKRNAMTPAMLDAMLAAIKEASQSGTRAIVLSGEGDTFCAGFDLTLCQHDDGALAKLLQGLAACVRALNSVPCPVIVSAHGAAIAGGCALLGAGDFIVTTTSAKLGYPVVRLGISPAVSAPTLARLTGDGPARTRLLDAGLIDGPSAVRIGLAHECVETAQACKERSHALALALATKPPHALAATKRWLREVDGSDTLERLDAALHASLALVNTPEQRELLPQAWAPRDAPPR